MFRVGTSGGYLLNILYWNTINKVLIARNLTQSNLFYLKYFIQTKELLILNSYLTFNLIPLSPKSDAHEERYVRTN